MFSLYEFDQISDVGWLAPPSQPTTIKLSLTDFMKRTELMEEFIYWLLDSLIIHLIRTNFYVTETSVHKNRVFYFRHDIWREISSPSINELRHNMLEEVPKVASFLFTLMAGRSTSDTCQTFHGILIRQILTEAVGREMHYESSSTSV